MRRCFLLILAGNGAWAATLSGQVNGITPKKHPPYTVSLDPNPVEHISSSFLRQFDSHGTLTKDFSLLRLPFQNWTFNLADDAPGDFHVVQYEAFALTTLGGADFVMTYNDGVAAERTDYDWLQIGHPHNWGSFGSQDFADSEFGNFPFYGNYTPDDLGTLNAPSSYFGPSVFLNVQNYPNRKIQNNPGGGLLPANDLLFVDEPYCSYTCVPDGDFSSIWFELYLVSFTWNGKLGADAGGTINIHDGVKWGVKITKEAGGGGGGGPEKLPEPGTFVALGSGLLVIGHRRARNLMNKKRHPTTSAMGC